MNLWFDTIKYIDMYMYVCFQVQWFSELQMDGDWLGISLLWVIFLHFSLHVGVSFFMLKCSGTIMTSPSRDLIVEWDRGLTLKHGWPMVTQMVAQCKWQLFKLFLIFKDKIHRLLTNITHVSTCLNTFLKLIPINMVTKLQNVDIWSMCIFVYLSRGNGSLYQRPTPSYEPPKREVYCEP